MPNSEFVDATVPEIENVNWFTWPPREPSESELSPIFVNQYSKFRASSCYRSRDTYKYKEITYKLCVLMHGVAFDYAPTYLSLSTLPATAHLRSADSRQYDVPRVSTLAGSRAFSVASPQAWNQLPKSLGNMDCIATFKRHLKTILFELAYGVAGN